MSTLSFFSSTFSELIKNIKEKFSDFGSKPEDQITVNMAIPVAYIDSSKVRSHFKKILNISWRLAHEIDCPNTCPVAGLAEKVKELEHIIDREGYSMLCKVYPEVFANMRAFMLSPASSPVYSTIYFVSDAGAGTIDQTVFTFAGLNGERSFFTLSANVFPWGSSQIEIIACGDEINVSKLERLRLEKEKGSSIKELEKAKTEVLGEVQKKFNENFSTNLKNAT